MGGNTPVMVVTVNDFFRGPPANVRELAALVA